MTKKNRTPSTVGRTRAVGRRQFLKAAAGAAGLACLPGRIRAAEAPAILPVKNPNSRLQVAIVGLGGISAGHIATASRHEHLVALCECYPERTEAKIQWMKSTLTDMNVKPGDMKKYLDYREMLEDMAGKIDAVQVCTPDHNHAIIGMDCIQRGIHIFIEKPMAYTIHEAFALREAARKHKVAAQMGNEGHSWPSIRRAVEYLQAGAIGPVHEVHHWCVGRAIGGDHTGMQWAPMKHMRPEFELWSVPVPKEEAYKTLSGGTPDPDPLAKPNGGDRRWHNGTLGDWAPHTMDAAYWGLKIDQAPTCKIEMLERRWGGDKLHYKMEVFQWTIPERADMPELKQYWYSGVKPNLDPSLKDEDGKVRLSVPNMPPKVAELAKKYNRNFGEFGSIFFGQKGCIFTGPCSNLHGTVPHELANSIPPPPETLPRAKGDNVAEWFHAIRTGEPSSASFEYSSAFTEHYLSGVLASLVPLGTVIEYDRVNHKVLNLPQLNQYITRKYRKGYEIV